MDSIAPVDISGIRKATLLRQMWWNSQPKEIRMFAGIYVPTFDDRLVSRAISNGHIETFCGRYIGTDISSDLVDPSNFDRINGDGALQAIIDILRS